MKRFYFDYNATTPLADCVRDFFGKHFSCGNVSSIHHHGRQARRALEGAREKVAWLLSCEPDEVIFNSGTTEGNNTVLHSAWYTRVPGRNVIVVSGVEHDSLTSPLESLARLGAVIRILPVNARGEIDEQVFAGMVDEKTFLVSMMRANNETGMILPIEKLVPVAQARGALFHTDAACALGKMPLSFSALGVDFLTGSGHKFYGPMGTGFLIKKNGTPFESLLKGGTQERGLRSGTVNVLGIRGLALALDYALGELAAELTCETNLRLELIAGLKALKPDLIVHESSNQLPGTLSVALPGVSNELLVASLDLEGISVSTGSACHSGAGQSSQILLSMGIPKIEVDATVRLSFGRMTTGEDIAGCLGAFKKVLKRM